MIIVSNSIPMEESGKIAFLVFLFLRAFLDHCGGHVMDLLLSEAMRRIHHGESMSLMFSGVDRKRWILKEKFKSYYHQFIKIMKPYFC